MDYPKENWRNFRISIYLHLIIPLFPLILVSIGVYEMSPGELQLFTCMWAFYIGISSRHIERIIIICIFGGFMLAMLGKVIPSDHDIKGYHNLLSDWRVLTIMILFFEHAIERKFRHLDKGESLFDDLK